MDAELRGVVLKPLPVLLPKTSESHLASLVRSA